MPGGWSRHGGSRYEARLAGAAAGGRPRVGQRRAARPRFRATSSPWRGRIEPVIVRTVLRAPRIGRVGHPRPRAPVGLGRRLLGSVRLVGSPGTAAPGSAPPVVSVGGRGAGHGERVVVIRRRRFRAMGTDVELLVESDSDAESAMRLEAAEREVRRLEGILSRFRRRTPAVAAQPRRRDRRGPGAGPRWSTWRSPGERATGRALRPDGSRRRGRGRLRPLVRAMVLDGARGPVRRAPPRRRGRRPRSRQRPSISPRPGRAPGPRRHRQGLLRRPGRRGAVGDGAVPGQRRRRPRDPRGAGGRRLGGGGRGAGGDAQPLARARRDGDLRAGTGAAGGAAGARPTTSSTRGTGAPAATDLLRVDRRGRRRRRGPRCSPPRSWWPAPRRRERRPTPSACPACSCPRPGPAAAAGGLAMSHDPTFWLIARARPACSPTALVSATDRRRARAEGAPRRGCCDPRR